MESLTAYYHAVPQENKIRVQTLGLIMTASRMGTLARGNRTAGRLSADEKIALARNLASLRAEMVFDEARYRLGLLRPTRIELDALTPPDTKLVCDADDSPVVSTATCFGRLPSDILFRSGGCGV